MKTAVLISIRPKWCELFSSGQKTIEVRKTNPKIETPFKCYIYCTSPKYEYEDLICFCSETEDFRAIIGGRLVIGEFTCDAILPISVTYSDPDHRLANRVFPYTGMTDGEIMEYLGNGNPGYGWHISHLVIYDKPKELGEFRSWNTGVVFKDGYPMPTHEIKRPPQSWMYVEEL